MYVSTDDPRIADIGRGLGAAHLPRPPELCTDGALLEDAIHHAFLTVSARHPLLDLVVITQCNAPYLTAGVVTQAVQRLAAEPRLDSVITVVRMDGFAPERARAADENGWLTPYVPLEAFNRSVSCDRASQRPAYFYDSALTVVRAAALLDLRGNLPPFRWMGRRIGFIEQQVNPGDIDYAWQIPLVEHWLLEAGIVRAGTGAAG
jgi:CMP-N-acetylneuraminic acid synthetase